ncbi:hypothetical protein AURDEDRAFT_176682 [Auricularia subglabra TFB-10046 SS5]|uniref:Uncharacterized protein n=1 Tax=Auricularia subglabra (strain TFB-10046 / SS5) TaxID=717982 RepID=J0D5Z3_AURST|nr:hypothetical protein AURDEDRAFT_176682 [Auricularia subglabra TFB-10046 SS5]
MLISQLRSVSAVLKRRKDTRKKDEPAHKVLASTGYDIDHLDERWALQRAAELSVRSHPTKKLKKSLDAGLQLQEQVDAIDESIRSTRRH